MTELLTRIPPEILERIGELQLNIESTNCEKAIEELLSTTVLDGGKRLRPMLTYLMGRVVLNDISKLDPFAKAIEMVHAASLAHDDVVDNATMRRSSPSINAVSSNKRAVLAGDYLLADVIYNLSHQGDLEIVKKMSCVITDLAVGEWVQSDAIEQRSYSRELIERIAFLKTASVMSWCTWLPTHLAGLDKEAQKLSYDIGKHIGIAFQMMDDTLDFSKESQKDSLLDIKNNIVNSVILEWLELNPGKFEKYKSGTDLIEIWSDDRLEEAVDAVTKRSLAHMDKAKESLNKLVEISPLGQKMAKDHAEPIEFIMSYIVNRSF